MSDLDPTQGFEGSYMGAKDRISGKAIMECKICWTPYDPAEGDDTRQVDPGTPFFALPEDWSCPSCGAPKEQFMVESDPGAADVLAAQKLAPIMESLEQEFTEIWHQKMRDVPMVNKALRVQAVAFQFWNDRPLGVLISPWFMNLVLMPAEGEDWSGLTAGVKEDINFPSGIYEFIHNTRGLLGGYKACSLFSPMGDFPSQAHAVDVARAVMVALFDETNQAETDRSADIRAAREAEVTAQAEAEEAAIQAEAEAGAEERDSPVAVDPTPTRRAVITGGLGAGAETETRSEAES